MLRYLRRRNLNTKIIISGQLTSEFYEIWPVPFFPFGKSTRSEKRELWLQISPRSHLHLKSTAFPRNLQTCHCDTPSPLPTLWPLPPCSLGNVTYGKGLFWCKEDRSIDQLLTAVSFWKLSIFVSCSREGEGLIKWIWWSIFCGQHVKNGTFCRFPLSSWGTLVGFL